MACKKSLVQLYMVVKVAFGKCFNLKLSPNEKCSHILSSVSDYQKETIVSV